MQELYNGESKTSTNSDRVSWRTGSMYYWYDKGRQWRTRLGASGTVKNRNFEYELSELV